MAEIGLGGLGPVSSHPHQPLHAALKAAGQYDIAARYRGAVHTYRGNVLPHTFLVNGHPVVLTPIGYGAKPRGFHVYGVGARSSMVTIASSAAFCRSIASAWITASVAS